MKEVQELDKTKEDSVKLKKDLDMTISQISSISIKEFIQKVQDKISCILHVIINIIEFIVKIPIYLIGFCVGSIVWTLIFGLIDSNNRRNQKIKKIYIFSEEQFRDIVNSTCPKKMKDKSSSENDEKE